ncbi:uncharacterized protein LOC144709122 [Wolffia australiana]
MAAAAADSVRMTHQPFRSSSSYKSSPADRRQGKKMSMPELRAMEDSLLEEQKVLRKELSRQEEIYGVLLEENTSLKSFKSSSRSPPMREERPREVNGGGVQLTPNLPAGVFPFDLNCLPNEI